MFALVLMLAIVYFSPFVIERPTKQQFVREVNYSSLTVMMYTQTCVVFVSSVSKSISCTFIQVAMHLSSILFCYTNI